MESNWIDLIPGHLKALALSRVHLAEAKVALAKFKESNDEYVGLYAAIELHQLALNLADEVIREYALDHFKKTEERHPCAEVVIKDFTSYDYDLGDATKWAKEEAAFLLIVDKKGFEKMIKGMQELPDFVTKKVNPKATIATKLGHLLEDQEEGGKGI